MGLPDGEIEAAAVLAGVPSICPAIDDGAEAESGECAEEQDPFAGGAEDIAANETRRKIELFDWADSVLELNEADLELALEDAVKHFKMTRASLKRIIAARRSEKAKAKAGRGRAKPDDDKNNVKYYSLDFKVSDRGVFARKLDDNGHPIWDKICTTRIEPEVRCNRDRQIIVRKSRGGAGAGYSNCRRARTLREWKGDNQFRRAAPTFRSAFLIRSPATAPLMRIATAEIKGGRAGSVVGDAK